MYKKYGWYDEVEITFYVSVNYHIQMQIGNTIQNLITIVSHFVFT